jgi:hypothetical protein
VTLGYPLVGLDKALLSIVVISGSDNTHKHV